MRIVAGKFRGRSIDAPTGEGTRPTTDRAREALFSSLYSLRGGFEGAVVLDAFAGSGALGIEAISRGARQAVFCESDSKAAAVLKRNLSALGIDAPVLRRDVLAMPPVGYEPAFDLVFLDPPYAYDAKRVLEMAKTLRLAGAITVYEHAAESKGAVAEAAGQAGFAIAASKKYGKTGVTILT